MASPDRIAYFNGRFVPEREVLVPFRDRGFKYGDAVFDTTRTFAHRVFKLREHVERLYRSLRYLRIDPGLASGAMIDITEEVLRRNLPLLEPDEDYWVTQRVSRGIEAAYRNVWPQDGATVIVECVPLPLRERATLYRDGIRVMTPSVRRTPPQALSPRVKTHNYLNMIAGDLGGGDPARREGPRPLRRVQRRRGVPHVDEPLYLPGRERQRRADRDRRARAPDAAAHRGLLPVRRLRLRGAVSETAGLSTQETSPRPEAHRKCGMISRP